MYGPHPGSEPQSVRIEYVSDSDHIGSNYQPIHPSNNSYPGNGARLYHRPEGEDNFITQPVPRLTDIDYGFPPDPAINSMSYLSAPEVIHGRVIVSQPIAPKGLPPAPERNIRRWRPLGANLQYQMLANEIRNMRNRSNRPATSEGYNTL